MSEDCWSDPAKLVGKKLGGNAGSGTYERSSDTTRNGTQTALLVPDGPGWVEAVERAAAVITDVDLVALHPDSTVELGMLYADAALRAALGGGSGGS